MGSRSEIFNVASGFYHVSGSKNRYFRCKDPKVQFGLDYKETMLRRGQKMSLFVTFCQFYRFWSFLSTTGPQFCNQEMALLWLQNGHFCQLGNVTFCHFWGARMCHFWGGQKMSLFGHFIRSFFITFWDPFLTLFFDTFLVFFFSFFGVHLLAQRMIATYGIPK
jgi:hypothetical protein